MTRSFATGLAAFALLSSSALAPAATKTPVQPTTPIDRPSVPIRGQYIVVFKDSVQDPRAEVANLNRGNAMRVKYVYDLVLKGFAAEIPDKALVALQNNPQIAFIEADQTANINTTTQPYPPSWGLDRIDQSLPIVKSGFDNSYNYDYDGTGVTAYVIDTGIQAAHTEFATGGLPRVAAGYSAFGGDTTDCNGHGTHVAGTIGGTTTGVAKGVSLVPVRVLDCNGSGSWSGVIAGVNWVAANAAGKKAVANMSLGGGASTAVDTAVKNAIQSGVTFVVAAGNSNKDAKNYSPARVKEAITVGATASNDTRASYSNYGSVVDIFAPGSSIKSAWYTGTTAMNIISGTSMATPHVAGSVALLLQEKSLPVAPSTPTTVTSQLLSDAEKDLTLNTRGGSNNFLNTNYGKQRQVSY